MTEETKPPESQERVADAPLRSAGLATRQSSGPFLRRDDAAAYVRQKHKINCTAGYLAKLASIGGGPVFHRLHSRWALYTEPDLDAWAKSRISGPLRKASDAAVQVNTT